VHYKKYLKSSINNIVHKEQNKERRNNNKTMQELNIKYMNIRDLKPYKKNAKKHNKEQVEQIANSIKEFGFTQPVIIDKNNEVVAGHGRILGAKKAGLKQVPTVCLEELTEEQIKAYRLVDNKLNESEWDNDLLNTELSELWDAGEVDMTLFDFNMDNLFEEPKEKEVKFKTKEKHDVVLHFKNTQDMNRAFKTLKDKYTNAVVETKERN
jgi:hypothetical protein